MDRDLLDGPRTRGLLRQVAERLAGGVREAAAAADPGAVEALAEEERQQREGDQRAEEAPADDQERLLQDHRRVQVLDLERPEVREVVLVPAEHLQHQRQHEREHDLDRDDAAGANDLVAARAVAPQEEGPSRDHRQRVDRTVEQPLALERLRQAEGRAERLGRGLQHVEAQPERGDRAEVQQQVRDDQYQRERPGEPRAVARGMPVRVHQAYLHRRLPRGAAALNVPPRRSRTPGSEARAPRRTAPARGAAAPTRAAAARRSRRAAARGPSASRAC